MALEKYHQDQRSIYVGNLPEKINESELRALFNRFGLIIDVNMIKKTSGDGMRQ
jgi:RNA recognition motif-containing protein